MFAISAPNRTATSSAAAAQAYRGFTLRVQPGVYGTSVGAYGYAVLHRGLLLHHVAGAFRTPGEAERAARQLVDDALCAFDRAVQSAEELGVTWSD